MLNQRARQTNGQVKGAERDSQLSRAHDDLWQNGFDLDGRTVQESWQYWMDLTDGIRCFCRANGLSEEGVDFFWQRVEEAHVELQSATVSASA